MDKIKDAIGELKKIRIGIELDGYDFPDNATDTIDYIIKTMEAVAEAQGEISLCPHCYCMTKNICGKCKNVKEKCVDTDSKI